MLQTNFALGDVNQCHFDIEFDLYKKGKTVNKVNDQNRINGKHGQTS